MNITEAYKEHIEYTFHAFCRIVIRYAAMNAWCDRSKRWQREISFEYLTEEKYHSLSALDGLFINPYEEYPVTICGQTIMLNSGELAEALSVLPEKKREIIYLYFFGNYTQQEIGNKVSCFFTPVLPIPGFTAGENTAAKLAQSTPRKPGRNGKYQHSAICHLLRVIPKNALSRILYSFLDYSRYPAKNSG